MPKLFGPNTGAAFGQALQKSLQYVQQHQQQSRLNNALQEAEALERDQSLNPQEKLFRQSKLLSEFPVFMKQIQEQQYRNRSLDLEQEKIRNTANKPSPTNKFSPLPPDQQEIYNRIKADPKWDSYSPQKKYDIIINANLPVGIAESEKKAALETAKLTQQEKEMFHRESSDYFNKVLDQSEAAERQLTGIHEIRDALKKNKTGPLTWQNFFKKHAKGTFLENLGLTPEGAVIEATIPQFLEGMKQIFGTRITDADLALLAGKLPDLGKSPEANEAILKVFEKLAHVAEKRGKLAQEIVKENGNYRPPNFRGLLNERLNEKYGNELDSAFDSLKDTIEMITPQGVRKRVPINDLEKAEKKGLIRAR